MPFTQNPKKAAYLHVARERTQFVSLVSEIGKSQLAFWDTTATVLQMCSLGCGLTTGLFDDEEENAGVLATVD